MGAGVRLNPPSSGGGVGVGFLGGVDPGEVEACGFELVHFLFAVAGGLVVGFFRGGLFLGHGEVRVGCSFLGVEVVGWDVGAGDVEAGELEPE